MPRIYPLDAALARELRRRRVAAGLSQNQVALAAGLTEIAISRYESLRYPIPPDKRAAIERALAEAERKVVVGA